MNKICLIHNNNISYEDHFDEHIKFSLGSVDIDKYISQSIIQKLKDKNYSIIYIKDNLSSSYLELYGLRVAYHIRLSSELSFNERCLPIVIISDVDIYSLNKLSPLASILFTKNIFTIKNDRDLVSNFNIEKIQPFIENEYKTKFLNLIEIEAPKESHHDIANEWAIYKWAKELKLSDDTDINNILEKLSSQLYFKYVKAKYSILDNIEILPPPKRVLNNNKKINILRKVNIEEKKILYIDDEHNKGWDVIFKEYFSKKRGYTFKPLDITYKDNNFIDIDKPIIDAITTYEADLIILDMRLVDSDHKKETLPEDISGIKILNSIKNISIDTKLNPGIQVIMLTASGRSDILDEALKDNKIVGYIKKEHPEDITINTKENIEKLNKYINICEENFYLKEIWDIQYDILNLDMFNNKKYNQIKVEVSFIFEILNADIENKFKFSMLTIYKVLEMIRDLYIDDRGNSFLNDNKSDIKAIYARDDLYNEVNKDDFIYGYEKHHYLDVDSARKYYYSTANKVHAIAYEKLLITDKVIHDQINSISQKRNTFIHPLKKNSTVDVNNTDIIEWFKMLQVILTAINNKKVSS